MSEKRSWDIQPKRRVPPPAPAAPARPQPTPSRREPPREMRRAPRPVQQPSRPEPALRVVRPAPSAPMPKGKDREPLKARRRRARNRFFTTLFILILLIVAGGFGSLWFPEVRIQHVQTGGPDSDGMQTIASGVLLGTYHYMVPRNSIFFFPEDDIRSQILAQYPDISAVSISRVSFNTIAVVSIPREAALTWCGATYNPSDTQVVSLAAPVVDSSSTDATASLPSEPTCYSADAQGIIFASLSEEVASSSDALRIYDPLAANADSTMPLGATIGEANMIPNALQFVKAIKSLGVPIVALVIRGDEADLYAQSGTRITYVLGQEEVSAQLAEAAFPSLNLNDGSLEYVDLRFAGKVYFKKFGDLTSTEATSTKSH